MKRKGHGGEEGSVVSHDLSEASTVEVIEEVTKRSGFPRDAVVADEAFDTFPSVDDSARVVLAPISVAEFVTTHLLLMPAFGVGLAHSSRGERLGNDMCFLQM